MKKIQISLIILFLVIILVIIYIYYIKTKKKLFSNFPVIPSKNYRNEFSEYLKNNTNVNDECVNCLFNKMNSLGYTYSDFKEFLYLSEHNDDPNVNLSQNNFSKDLLVVGENQCNCN